jgi:ubiquinone/menaquinone biosynthesis C-methylase UbiE
MPSEKQVYAEHADQYERLIQREDWQNNIEHAIEQILSPDGMLDIVDLGAGTGRLTRLLARRAHSIAAFDASAHMLAVTETFLRASGLANWRTAVADHRKLPVPDQSIDLVVSGWSFCYLAVWGGSEWESALEAGLAEIERILRPSGTAILFETLGTSHASPNPPEKLAGYYAWLAEKGFQSTWIRTDYKFASLEEAVELAAFFFGAEMGAAVRANNWQVLPECTGMWWRRKFA